MRKTLFKNVEKLVQTFNVIENKLNKWHLEPTYEHSGKTSLSDEQEYLSICVKASSNEEVFTKFRSCIEYKAILEHVDANLGAEYLAILLQRGYSPKKIQQILDGRIGKPSRFWYQKIGKASPTELRYIKVLSDLEEIFGSLTDFRIAEVGVGFGGQCSTVMKQAKILSYDLVDLPEVLDLASKYLKCHQIEPRINLCKDFLPSEKDFDLFVSNYALSELKYEVQMHYINNFILRSKRGYVIYNHITPKEFGTLSADDFSKFIPGSIVVNEIPCTHPGNKLIIWGYQ